MIVHGVHAVREALAAENPKVEKILIRRRSLNPRLQKIVATARRRGIPVEFEAVSRSSAASRRQRHEEVSARVSGASPVPLESILRQRPSLLLAVDGVQDPNNLGALLRTAEAVGIEGVLIPRRRSCSITPSVVTASAGAALHLKICRVSNLSRTLDQLKQAGFWIVGLDPGGSTGLDQIDATLRLVVVVGGEHQGLRRLVRRQCDYLAALPMQGRVASLNLSVAAGVLLYHISFGRTRSRRGRDQSTAQIPSRAPESGSAIDPHDP